MKDGVKKAAACWAVASLKGGVGKTTTAATVGHGLALGGNKVLIVDCDSQNQIRTVFNLPGGQRGLDAVLLREIDITQAITPYGDNLYILPAGDRLSLAARDINLKEIAQEKALTKVLAPVMDVYDYIIFDSSPGWDIILVNTLVAAQYVISPLTMQVLSIESYGKFLNRLEPIIQEKPGFEVTIVLPTIYDCRLKDARNILEQLQEMMPGKLATPIRKRVQVERAHTEGTTIMETLRPAKDGEAPETGEVLETGKMIVDLMSSDCAPEGVVADYLDLIRKIVEVSKNE